MECNLRPGPREPIAIIRLDDLSEAAQIGQALLAGGIRTFEFTLTSRRALNAIDELRTLLREDALVGAGTVLDYVSAEGAIRAGAQFLVTPVYRQEVTDCGNEHGVPVVCGAFSPTEILDAWQGGADFVKVFPARGLGPKYMSDLLAPLPDLKLIPTGGVNLENCAAFLEAGAYTVAVGSSLVNEDIVRRGEWQALTELAGRYVEACAGVELRSHDLKFSTRHREDLL